MVYKHFCYIRAVFLNLGRIWKSHRIFKTAQVWESPETDLLVWGSTGHWPFLKAPHVFLTGGQGFEPLLEGLESLPFTASAQPEYDVWFHSHRPPQLDREWWGVDTWMNTEWFFSKHAKRKRWCRMATIGSTRSLAQQTFLRNHCNSG